MSMLLDREDGEHDEDWRDDEPDLYHTHGKGEQLWLGNHGSAHFSLEMSHALFLREKIRKGVDGAPPRCPGPLSTPAAPSSMKSSSWTCFL